MINNPSCLSNAACSVCPLSLSNTVRELMPRIITSTGKKPQLGEARTLSEGLSSGFE